MADLFRWMMVDLFRLHFGPIFHRYHASLIIQLYGIFCSVGGTAEDRFLESKQVKDPVRRRIVFSGQMEGCMRRVGIFGDAFSPCPAFDGSPDINFAKADNQKRPKPTRMVFAAY